MAPRPFAASSAQRLIDVAVPALAGLAILFVAFAAPDDLVDRLVAATGLPSFIHAAAPPLGLKARLAIGVTGGAVTFAFAFLLLRAIDRLTTRPVRAAPVLAPEPEAPRLRRRDLHPDAPPRPPISAIRDLGEPAPPEAPLARPACEPVVEEAPSASAEEAPAASPAASAPEPVRRQDSLADLMARLERGLADRAARTAPQASVAAPEPQVFPSLSDDRLAGAIENLQRLAAMRRGQAAH